MKTLVIQLARLGDVYQTWPVIRALKKQGHGQVDLVTRAKFSQAAAGLEALDKQISIDSKKIFAPVINDNPRPEKSVAEISDLVEILRAENYDNIINLSFSPFSSYLVSAIATSETQVTGYSRFADGFLAIPDDPSAYFFAQVGVGRPNRIHVTDLFAQVAHVQLTEDDWCREPVTDRKKRILIHVSASQEAKSFASNRWREVCLQLLSQSEYEIGLIGGKEDISTAESIGGGLWDKGVVNYVGKTSLQESLELIATSELLIGADSAPIHMAALTATPVLNLSFSSVNFFETGPKSAGSRILVSENPDNLLPQTVAVEALAMLENLPTSNEVVHVRKATVPYELPVSAGPSAAWNMICAVYLGADFQPAMDSVTRESFMRLFELNTLALDQLKVLSDHPQNQRAMETLGRCDELFGAIGRLSDVAGVLTRWLEAEKLRLGPVDVVELIRLNEKIHSNLENVLKVYPLNKWYQRKNGVLHDKDILDKA